MSPTQPQPMPSSGPSGAQARPPWTLADLARTLALGLPKKYVPHQPHPPQWAFLSLPQLEALYGGAAGGGKSDALLMGALQYVHVPGYAAIIFRRTYADLAKPGAIMDRAAQWLRGTDAVWNAQTHTWRFPSTAVLTFGHLEHEADKYEYQGTEFQYEGFDELTQFTESQYTYMLSRLRRRKGINVPLRARGGTNPGGSGHEWVFNRFLLEGPLQGRPFVPALLEDNPSIDREEYERSLQQLDPLDYEHLRHGNWEAIERGPLFDKAWFGIVDEAPADARRVRYWDMAATEESEKKKNDPDWTVGTHMSEKDGIFYIEDVVDFREEPFETERRVKATSDEDFEAFRHALDTWMEQEPGSAGKRDIDRWARETFKGRSFQANKETGNKRLRMKPLSRAAKAGNVKLLRAAWNRKWLNHIHVTGNPGEHDDHADSAAGAFARLNEGEEGWVV